MYTFENYQLGIDNDEVQISTSEEHLLSATLMAQQCRREISIISRELDPQVYAMAGFVDAVKNTLLDNRHLRVRVIVFESKLIVSRGHLLVKLAGNLPSFIEFRKPGKEYMDFDESLFVADSTGYIYRKNTQRFDGQLNFRDKHKSRLFMDVFEEMWSRSKPDPNFRKLSL